MFDVIYGSGRQSQYLEAFVYILKEYFILIKKKLPYQGAIPRLIKFLPCAESFFLSLTDDIFVICNFLKKHKKNTYHNMHFDKNCLKSTWYIFQASDSTDSSDSSDQKALFLPKTLFLHERLFFPKKTFF